MNTKNHNLVQLGEQLRRKRIQVGISQEQLALKAEIDRSYYGGIERGERNLTFLTLVKIASVLNCDISSLTKNIPHE
ncbi:helix-turn-helix domain-containing protein [Mariniphaga sediminis]|uniref:helix-turn-helix domain-containing protein n=1 Tax=Mariniphaga sediminis TaxID=1628158 RepID=UPI003561490D